MLPAGRPQQMHHHIRNQPPVLKQEWTCPVRQRQKTGFTLESQQKSAFLMRNWSRPVNHPRSQGCLTKTSYATSFSERGCRRKKSSTYCRRCVSRLMNRVHCSACNGLLPSSTRKAGACTHNPDRSRPGKTPRYSNPPRRWYPGASRVSSRFHRASRMQVRASVPLPAVSGPSWERSALQRLRFLAPPSWLPGPLPPCSGKEPMQSRPTPNMPAWSSMLQPGPGRTPRPVHRRLVPRNKVPTHRKAPQSLLRQRNAHTRARWRYPDPMMR